MTADTDYSIRPPGGTREIANPRTVSNEKEERRRRRKKKRQRRDEPPGEAEGVQVELSDTEIPPDAAEAEDEDSQDATSIDYLA